MKDFKGTTLLFLLLVSLTESSCSAVEGIFKAGMGVGIFIVVTLIIIAFVVIRKIKDK